MLSLVLVFSALAFPCQAQKNSRNETFVQRNVNVTEVVASAAHWLLDQRGGADNTWGDFTPRAVVALALAENEFPLPQEEWSLMTKQINILLSLELKKGGAKALGLSRLALFTNALYATCQDPRRFHGLDLVRELRAQTTAALGAPSRNFSLPAVFMPLCLAGETGYDDVVHLAHMYSAHESKADLRALEVMAMACVTRQGGFGSSVPSYMDSFTRWFPTVSGSADVYTKALGFQAMNVNEKVVDPSPLVLNQESSGSFGSLLATYYAIPALLGKTVLSLKDRQCGNKTLAGRFADSAFSSSSSTPKVYFSIWIGEGDDRDSHTITVANIANKTFFDVMTVAQSRNPIFKFSYDQTDNGKRVYSLAGLPNDVEREIYWTLFLTKGSPNGPDPRRLHAKHLITAGVERVYPTAEDHFVFWFRRKL